jgi:hypothetical protein
VTIASADFYIIVFLAAWRRKACGDSVYRSEPENIQILQNLGVQNVDHSLQKEKNFIPEYIEIQFLWHGISPQR